MTFAAYLAGGAALLAVVAPLAAAAVTARRRLLPTWVGTQARLAEVALTVGFAVVLSDVLGAVGLFRRVPLLAGSIGVGVLGAVAARRGQAVAPVSPNAAAPPRWPRALLVIVVAAALATLWTSWMAVSFRYGILEDDSVAYHLPFAARFAQSGWTTRLPFLTPDLPSPFFPANSELVHAMGMVTFGRDLLSPVLNTAWLGLVLLAAWVAGRSQGAGHACLVGVALVFALPVMVVSQAGSAESDTASIAFLLVAVAVVLGDRRVEGRAPAAGNSWWWAPAALGGLASGLAVGTKLTMVAPIGALWLGVVVAAAAGRRRTIAVVWAAAALVGGGIWYVRNLVLVGSPLPGLDLDVGPIGLPSPDLLGLRYYHSIGDYLLDPGVLRTILPRGLDQALGPLWFVVLGLAGAGIFLALVRGPSRAHRVVAVTALTSAVAYVFTPSTALGFRGLPQQVYVTANLRYLVPALVLGLLLLPLTPVFEGRRRHAVVAVELAVAVATAPTVSDFWRAWLPGNKAAALGVAAAVVAAGCAGVLVVRHAGRVQGGARGVACIAVAVVGLLAFWPLADGYLERRYTEDPRWGLTPLFEWARSTRDASIATAGHFQNFPHFGLDLSNRVQPLGVSGPHRAFAAPTTCGELRAAVDAGHFDYVVVAPYRVGQPVPTEAAWIRTAPNVSVVVDDGRSSVFRVGGRLGTTGCG